MKHRKLFIAACARSGTLYISNVMRRAGLRIGHEYVGEDGTASHFFVSSRIAYPRVMSKSPEGRCIHIGERRADFQFEHVWHQVRDPLLVIGSLRWTGLNAAMLDACAIHRVDNALARATRYYYGWNMLCETQAEWRYRIEDIDTVFPEMRRRLGLPAAALPPVPRDMNHALRYSQPFVVTARDEDGKVHNVPYHDKKRIIDATPPLTYDDLYAVEPEYAEKVRVMAERYGYP